MLSKTFHGHLDRVKRIWYLSPMRAAKVQASLRIRAVSPEPSLLAHTSSESRGTFRQKTRSVASLNGWACAVEICHDGMLEDTNSLDEAHLKLYCCSNIKQVCCNHEDLSTPRYIATTFSFFKCFETCVTRSVIRYVYISCDESIDILICLMLLLFFCFFVCFFVVFCLFVCFFCCCFVFVFCCFLLFFFFCFFFVFFFLLGFLGHSQH